MGPIWGRQCLVGPHAGPMIFAIWVYAVTLFHHSVREGLLSNYVISIVKLPLFKICVVLDIGKE